MSTDPKIAAIAEQVMKEMSGAANVNTGERHGGQSVTNVSHSGDYHAGDYAETVYGDQTSR